MPESDNKAKVELNLPGVDMKSLVKQIVRRGRRRDQEGWVDLVHGNWVGYWKIYVRQEDGTEVRKRRQVTLGSKKELRKIEAKDKLRKIILDDPSTGSSRPDPNRTFRWFYENRFLPTKEGHWSPATKSNVQNIMKKHVLPAFGQEPLAGIDKVTIINFLNHTAQTYSESLTDKAYIYIKAIFAEAIDQEYLERNPCRKIELPKTRKPTKRYLTLKEIRCLDQALKGRDRLIFRLLVIAGLRPGELFALRSNDYSNGQIRVDESIGSYKRTINDPKTEDSAANVPIPREVNDELLRYQAKLKNRNPEAFLFPGRYGGFPIHSRTFLRRVLKPLAEKKGITNLTYQCLRRTFATHFQKYGLPKDAQSIMRHASIEMTMNVYTQPIPQSAREAQEAMFSALFWSDSGQIGKRSKKPSLEVIH